jgi:hypothetical protein
MSNSHTDKRLKSLTCFVSQDSVQFDCLQELQPSTLNLVLSNAIPPSFSAPAKARQCARWQLTKYEMINNGLLRIQLPCRSKKNLLNERCETNKRCKYVVGNWEHSREVMSDITCSRRKRTNGQTPLQSLQEGFQELTCCQALES